MDIAAKLFRDAKSNERLTFELLVLHKIYLFNEQNTTKSAAGPDVGKCVLSCSSNTLQDCFEV